MSPELSPPGWRTQYVDYLILALTTSTAFSPTDVHAHGPLGEADDVAPVADRADGRRARDRARRQRLRLTVQPDERRERRVELFATILLAVAAVATAWSTYQSTQWRGQQAVNTSKATAARIESSEAATRAGQLTQIDIATFVQWTDAHLAGNHELAEFYRRRFRPEFQPAFAAWIATAPFTNPDAPLSPFAMPEYTRLRRRAELAAER